ncbi:MAG: hypothetical protein AB1656_22255 [Candidatus Omnitrophota bacterium]
MKAKVCDPETLQALKPSDLIAYLRTQGWEQESSRGDKAAIWVYSRNNKEEADILLPLRQDFDDYAIRMSEVLTILEKVEQRSQLDILNDLLISSADLIRVRSFMDRASDGTIALEDGVTFIQRTRDMLLSAACAAVNKKLYYATRKPQQVIDYMNQVRMGQTERGSYVVTVLSPVSPELKAEEAEHLFTISDPFEREVTKTLAAALNAAKEASNESLLTRNMKPFQEAVHKGVSVNLCEALSGLAQISPHRELEVSISWSRNREREKLPSKISFTENSISLIREYGRISREAAPNEGCELQGVVINLHSENVEEGGDATIFGLIDGNPRKAVVKLNGKDYTKAIQAHKKGMQVTCIGDLVKEGRSYSLVNLKQFTLEEEFE